MLPMRTLSVISILLLFSITFSNPGIAQVQANDTILLGGIVLDGDTLAVAFLDEVEIVGKLSRKQAKKHAANARLRHNVYKTYPYAVIAADVLKDVDEHLANLPEKQARKAYLKTVEKELKSRFKGELENMTISQGQVLVKLINRQTGENCFDILKEVKGGFNAVVYQSIALLFSNNLKKEYDPEGADREIELIVQEIEARQRYRYEMYKLRAQQGGRAAKS